MADEKIIVVDLHDSGCHHRFLAPASLLSEDQIAVLSWADCEADDITENDKILRDNLIDYLYILDCEAFPYKKDDRWYYTRPINTKETYSIRIW